LALGTEVAMRQGRNAFSTASDAFWIADPCGYAPDQGAKKADELGNLTYRLAARNFNPIMAKARNTAMRRSGRNRSRWLRFPPEKDVITPRIFVHRIVHAKGMRFAG